MEEITATRGESMIIEFVRCFYCSKVDEIGIISKRGHCKCGSRKIVKTTATSFELIVYTCITHPSIVCRALKEWVTK